MIEVSVGDVARTSGCGVFGGFDGHYCEDWCELCGLVASIVSE